MQSNTLSLAEARRIALAAQGFGVARSDQRSGWRTVRKSIDTMSVLQIDTINTVIRSHYLPAYSRIGAYDTAHLDQKAFHSDQRELFEYWGHEASLLPLALQPLFRWRMARAEKLQGVYKAITRLVQERPDYISQVLGEVRERGALSAKELSNNSGSSGWWTWSDGKTALEYLFWSGQLSASSRRGFERLYDLTERVLPQHIVDAPTPSEDEAQRELLKIAIRAFGVATESDLRDYFRLSAADAKLRVSELVESGALLPVNVADWKMPAYLHPTARIPRGVKASALLSPFDPLVWERSRTERLFDFYYRLEIYKPAAQRQYGYYVLPFLHDERLCARVDLKADRKTGVLHVLATHGEMRGDNRQIAEALAVELRHLASWLMLDRITVAERGSLAVLLRRKFR